MGRTQVQKAREQNDELLQIFGSKGEKVRAVW
jgi:hypothetical protein